MKAFQDCYPENVAHCCGSLNDHGHQIKTYWEGDETIARFTPARCTPTASTSRRRSARSKYAGASRN